MKKLNELLSERATIFEDMEKNLKIEKRTKEDETAYGVLETRFEDRTKEIDVLEKREKRNLIMKSVNIIDERKEDIPQINYKNAFLEFMQTGKAPDEFRGSRQSSLIIPDMLYRADPLLTTTNSDIKNKDVQNSINIKLSPGVDFLRGLGVTFYENLTGNFVIPSAAEMTAGFVDEAADVSTGNFTPEAVTLSERRVGASQSITYAFDKTTNAAIVSSILQNLVDALGNSIAIDFFKQAAADTPGSVRTTNETSLSYGNIVDIESSIGFLMSAPAYVSDLGVKAYNKQLATNGNGSALAWGNDNILNAHRAVAGTPVPADVLWFGDFKDGAVGYWGQTEIIVDPFTLAAGGKTKVTVSRLADSAWANERSLVRADVSANI